MKPRPKKEAPPKKTQKTKKTIVYGTTISLRLQPKQLEALDTLAAGAGMKRSPLIQLAIDRLLKQGL